MVFETTRRQTGGLRQWLPAVPATLGCRFGGFFFSIWHISIGVLAAIVAHTLLQCDLISCVENISWAFFHHVLLLRFFFNRLMVPAFGIRKDDGCSVKMRSLVRLPAMKLLLTCFLALDLTGDA